MAELTGRRRNVAIDVGDEAILTYMLRCLRALCPLVRIVLLRDTLSTVSAPMASGGRSPGRGATRDS
jgi:hypothetical protein